MGIRAAPSFWRLEECVPGKLWANPKWTFVSQAADKLAIRPMPINDISFSIWSQSSVYLDNSEAAEKIINLTNYAF